MIVLSYIVLTNKYVKWVFDMIDLSCRERAEVIAEYVIDTGATVRAAAIRFGISKSTVHKDLAYKLNKINPSLYERVKTVLDTNKSERHLIGGEATRRKYLLERSKRKNTKNK